jgi:hypothetical protein
LLQEALRRESFPMLKDTLLEALQALEEMPQAGVPAA